MSASETGGRALLLLGPTGVGKTPLGEVIEKRGLWQMRCAHFDFGMNLREAVRRNTPDGRLSRADLDFLREVLEAGVLLEDEHFPLAKRILESFLARRHVEPDTLVVLNGLPRHVGQAEAMEAVLDVRAVIHLHGSADTVLARIRTNAGGDRSDREDDDPGAIRHKLELFEQRTAPLLDYYRKRNVLVETIDITAETTPEAAWSLLQTRIPSPG